MKKIIIGRCQLWKIVFAFNEPPGHKIVQVQPILRKLTIKPSQNRISFNSDDHGKNIVDFKGETKTFTQLLLKV